MTAHKAISAQRSVIGKENEMDDNGKAIFEAMEQLKKQVSIPDPLEQKGIGGDWVCCMSSQTYADLKRQLEESHPFPYPGFVSSIDRVAALVRRRVFIFDDLAHGRLEFMPFEQAYARDLALLFQMRQVSGGGELTRIDDEDRPES